MIVFPWDNCPNILASLLDRWQLYVETNAGSMFDIDIRMFNDAIARANGAKAEASGRDGAVPAATVAGGAVGLRPGSLDIGFGGNLFGLRGQSPTPQGVDR